MCGTPQRFIDAENLREHGGVKFLMLAAIGTTMTFDYDSTCFSLLNLVCYRNTMIAGQLIKEKWLEEKGKKTKLRVSSRTSGKGQGVCVISHYPLSEATLVLLGRYAQGDPLSQMEFRDLLFAQAAHGIMMITAPQIILWRT